eukprot:15347412-Ditylum_brightwellii.AAC.1
MDVFLDSENIDVDELHPLNYVRYFNEATTLAKITTSNGTRIRLEFLQIACFQKKEAMKHHHKENTWPRHSEPDNHIKRNGSRH